MERKKLGIVLITFIMMTVLLFNMEQLRESIHAKTNQGETAYFQAAHPSELTTSTLPVTSEKEAAWLKQLEAAADKLHIAPIDARVDPVWKAIPGYNGRELDLQQSFEQTKQNKRLTYVFKEVAPRIALQDLGAHPVYKGNPHKPMVSFMINVAWGDEFIPGILETLRNEQVKATFFFDGSWLKKNEETAKQIAAEGHELSNHAYSHPNMSQLSRAAATEEITKTEALLRENHGVKNSLFAPPSGDFNEETVRIAYELGLQTVLWTLDTVDWKKPSPEWIIRRITSRVEPGSMILMHPTQSSSEALLPMIQFIKKKNLVLGTVSELLSPERIDLPPVVESAPDI